MTLYDQIKDDLLAKIKNGTYAVGEAIPSEMQLCDMYGVSRSTIRQAMQALVSEGYLEKRRRRGTVVTLPKVDQTFAMRIMSFEDEMKRAGCVPCTKVLTFKRVKATTEIASKLELEPGEDVYKLVRLRYADGTPNVFVESYIPCKPYQGFDAVNFEETSLYFAMSESGNPVERARRHLEVSKADVTTAALLDIEEYIQTKERVLADYEDQDAWMRKALINIANAGTFSSDRTISQYNDEIWHLN